MNNLISTKMHTLSWVEEIRHTESKRNDDNSNDISNSNNNTDDKNNVFLTWW